jgi:hypothetical protein
MRSGQIWSLVSVPVTSDGRNVEWRKISSLGKIRVVQDAKSFELITQNDEQIQSYDKIDQWKWQSDWLIKQVVIGMSTVVLNDPEIFLEIRDPVTPDRSPGEFKLIHGPNLLPYAGFPKNTLAVQLPFSNANRSHPIVNEAIDKIYTKEQSEFNIFAMLALRLLSENIPNLVGILKDLPFKGTAYNYLGHRYLDVDWEQLSDEFRPPYNVWLRDEGTLQICDENFVKWANGQ